MFNRYCVSKVHQGKVLRLNCIQGFYVTEIIVNDDSNYNFLYTKIYSIKATIDVSMLGAIILAKASYKMNMCT